MPNSLQILHGALDRLRVARTPEFDIDSTTGSVDMTLIRPSTAITITAARIVYSNATTGTVAGGNAKIGTAVGGAQIVAATSFENTKAVGVATPMTLTSPGGYTVPANTPVIVRFTGVAATQAGQAYVEIEYSVDS